MEYEGVVIQGGIEVAAVVAEDEEVVSREIAHYAMVFRQDGPVEVKIRRLRGAESSGIGVK